MLLRTFAAITVAFFIQSTAFALESETAATTEEQAEAEMPGDGLDLFAVLDTFANSESVEDFEKRLNDPDAELVNLDLDGDGEVDFVTVFEEAEGTAHVIFLRVPISEEESQDVAYIALDKVDDDVTVQVIGDEALYGPDYVVEPETSDVSLKNMGKPVQIVMAGDDWPLLSRPSTKPYDLAAVVVVSSWGIVRVVYAPGYVVWRSPYRYRHYPHYHRARRPVARSHYRHRHAHHARNNYRRTNVTRSHHASNVQNNHRKSSSSVGSANRATGGATRSSVNNQPGRATNSPTTQKSKTGAQQSGNKGHQQKRSSPSRGNQPQRRPSGGGGGRRR